MLNPQDLQELVRAGIINSDTAGQITRYYESKRDSSGSRFNTLLGILGALLVGAGIVLVVAHNWDELGKGLKTIFAFLPLVLGQVLCAYALLRKNESLVWRESGAVILFFGVAAAIALVSQIYQISGTLKGFVLTWLLLSAPIVYVMRSSVTSLMVIATATWYAYLVGYDYGSHDIVPWYYFGFLLFLAPYYYWYARNKSNSYFFHIHNWFLAVSLLITLGTVLDFASIEWGFAVYMALCSVFYLLGNTAFFKKYNILANPFLITGLTGTLIIFMIWSYGPISSYYLPPGWKISIFTLFAFHYVLILLLLIALVLITINYRSEKRSILDPVGFSAFLFLLCVLPDNNAVSTFLINCWVLLIGLFYIRKGSLQNHFGILNLGLLIILTLALLRFFDDGIPFLWRGIFFVLAGAGFFAANYWMLRKRKAITQNNNA